MRMGGLEKKGLGELLLAARARGKDWIVAAMMSGSGKTCKVAHSKLRLLTASELLLSLSFQLFLEPSLGF